MAIEAKSCKTPTRLQGHLAILWKSELKPQLFLRTQISYITSLSYGIFKNN